MEVNIKHDGNIDIAVGLSFSSKIWKNTNVAWSYLLEKLSEPVVTSETYKQFISATKEEQGRIKDVGGFVGGYLQNGKRKKGSVTYRQLLSLDIDFSHENFWDDFKTLFDFAAAIHTTHKSCKTNIRHRLLIPLSREISAEEYEPIARKIASSLNIELFDQSTYDVNRLMFWPSVSSDSEYFFDYQDAEWLDPDYVLSQYTDWRNVEEWPRAGAYDENMRKHIDKQSDPREKSGLIGAFCKAYTIHDAIEHILPDVYAKVDAERYTYTHGSTAAGAIVYDDIFLYSHHGTDPASGILCNAFDLVRIHKFGHLDKEQKKQQSDPTKKASFKAMEEFVRNDKRVKVQIAEEKLADAKHEFEFFDDEDIDTSWCAELSVNRNGDYESSSKNINLILQKDQVLSGAYSLNVFDNRRYLSRDMPWRKLQITGEMEPIRDVDFSGIRNYIECVYGIASSLKIDDAFAIEVEHRKFHPICDYLNSLKWDGKSRVDTLLIDYFGCDDTPFTRAAIRKSLCAAVARVFRPGTKYDMVLILVGPQGTYKSTFIKKLGVKWFSDTLTTVQGKEAYEQLQGAWIIEMAELSALKKSEVEPIKQFISKCEDSFRPAYGRTVEIYKRQCVFFGTTNNSDFLRDNTGNRRFNPVNINLERATKSVRDHLTDDEVAQIWAEAYEMYKNGEPLYFNEKESILAKAAQHLHTPIDERRGVIENFLERLLPDDWEQMDIFSRRNWLEDPLSKAGKHERQYVCMAEIWCECLGKDKTEMSRYATREINDILKTLDNWEFVQSTKKFNLYGTQRYFKRKDSIF